MKVTDEALRDEFAKAAIGGVIAGKQVTRTRTFSAPNSTVISISLEDAARTAYGIADAMIKVRKESPKEEKED